MTSGLIVLSVIDWRSYEIPASVNVYLFVLGVATLVLDFRDWQRHIFGAACVSGILALVYVLSNGALIGGGDVKLMFTCGLIIGWYRIILAFFLACIVASIAHLILMRVKNAGNVLAMGPYLSAGIFLSALWGSTWIRWYLSILCA